MPPPVVDWKFSASTGGAPSLRTWSSIARASGCSLGRSSAAAADRISRLTHSGLRSKAVTCGRPAVSVPVLSTTRVSIFSTASSASAFLMRIPSCAARPTPTMIETGVASPSAQGQAMMSTATAFTRARAMRGLRPPQRPGDEGEHRGRDHEWHEPAGHGVRDLLDRRAAALGVRDHVDDLRKQRFRLQFSRPSFRTIRSG